MEKRRLEYAIQATEGPLHIARDCLGNRQRRIDYDLVQDQADDEEEMSTDEERDKQTGSLIRGAPTATLLNSYRHTWKSRSNHFLRYSDVKSKVRERDILQILD